MYQLSLSTVYKPAFLQSTNQLGFIYLDITALTSIPYSYQSFTDYFQFQANQKDKLYA